MASSFKTKRDYVKAIFHYRDYLTFSSFYVLMWFLQMDMHPLVWIGWFLPDKKIHLIQHKKTTFLETILFNKMTENRCYILPNYQILVYITKQ